MQHFRRNRLAQATILAVTLAATALGAAGSPAAIASTGATVTAPITRQAAACPTARFLNPPISVTRNFHVPPVPVIKAVRAAKHLRCRFDRLVLDISGRIPGYSIRFVRHVIADPSGKTIKLPGRRFLLIVLRPAQAHKNSGVGTLPTKVQVLGFPMLRAWVLAGDFEGVVSLGVGLRAKTKVRVIHLHDRLVIDFKE